jgi:phosphoglycerate kinase
MKTLAQLPIKNKRVFLRLDLNVPLSGGKITDDLRIKNALPTIEYILKKQPKQLIIASHLGRPKGRDANLSLAPVVKSLVKYLGRPMYLAEDILAPLPDEPLVLLENLRYYPEEKEGNLAFAKKLAAHADIYVNDAFGTAHRKDASVFALANQFEHKSPGLLMKQELSYVHLNHKRPLVALFGAAKIVDKVKLLEKLLQQVDKVLLGGAVVFTFLKAMDAEVGTSLVEDEMIPAAKKIMKKYGDKLVFPVDVVVAAKSSLGKKMTVTERRKISSVVTVDALPKNKAGFDIGPQSIKLFEAVLAHAQTVIWNGPLGVAEIQPYDQSTKKLSKYLAEANKTVIVCGGDTAAAIRKTKYADAMTHISTGGGASLQLLGGTQLPAITVLEK